MPSSLLVLRVSINFTILLNLVTLLSTLLCFWVFGGESWFRRRSHILGGRQIDVDLNLSGGRLLAKRLRGIGFNILVEFRLCCRLRLVAISDFVLIGFDFGVVRRIDLSLCATVLGRFLLWVKRIGAFLHVKIVLYLCFFAILFTLFKSYFLISKYGP